MSVIIVCEECAKHLDKHTDMVDGEWDIQMEEDYILSCHMYSKLSNGNTFRPESDLCFDCLLKLMGLQRIPEPNKEIPQMAKQTVCDRCAQPTNPKLDMENGRYEVNSVTNGQLKLTITTSEKEGEHDAHKSADLCRNCLLTIFGLLPDGPPKENPNLPTPGISYEAVKIAKQHDCNPDRLERLIDKTVDEYGTIGDLWDSYETRKVLHLLFNNEFSVELGDGVPSTPHVVVFEGGAGISKINLRKNLQAYCAAIKG